jgi:hypothetical protein
VWFFQGSIFIEWKSTGSLLWIHGKRAFLSAFSRLAFLLTFSDFRSGLWEKYYLVCYSSPAYLSELIFFLAPPSLKTSWLYAKLDQPSWPIFTSISGISTSKAVTISCFLSYPSFLLPLVLTATFSTAFIRGSQKGARQPSDDTLKECLKEMLRLPGQGPIFIILDALDECPDSSGIPSPRSEVLELVKELVDLDLKRTSHLRDQSARGRHPSCSRAAGVPFRFLA